MSVIEGAARESRRQPRTNMFVMATLYSEAGSAPVKIRNLSPTGALVEGGVLPPPAARVSLSRGSLTIVGSVVWRTDARAGLKFEGTAAVADWLPNGTRSAPQQRVDEIVQQFKAAPDAQPISTDAALRPVTALELARAKKQIESLAEDLAEDLEVVVRHGSKLQSLDLAAQLLGKLAAERL